ncbi:MAG TPA: HipA domain-containing protein [Longimicrobium sp.]|uniref:HipA domain-containing protein n=1 Tax=Longimicrobium sp. TaxID=2029185 RepID=UPI002ED8D0C4
MTPPPELVVLLNQVEVGTLASVAGTGVYRLRYADHWRKNPYAYPVSLSLPLAAPEYEGVQVRNWLRGLLPDNPARLQEIETEYGVSRDDPYAVLAHVGEDCVGAVQFAAPERAAEIAGGRIGGTIEWLDETSLETLLAEIAARSAPDRRAVRTGQFSLPGALGKVALVWDPMRERWGRPSGQAPSTHILKPPMPGVANHNENEHFCLRLAQAVGLSAAKSRVVRYGSQGAIAVERYDRERWPDGTLSRLHQEDMAQALGLDPALKYAAEGGAGIREIVRLLRDYADPDDVGAFVGYVGYVWITATTDAHLRNFSLLISGGENAELAPLYDVASALGLVRGRPRRPLRMAMAIGGTTELQEIGRDAWVRELARSRLPRGVLDDVAALAERIAGAAPRLAEQLAEDEGLDGKFLHRLARDIAARANGCRSLLGTRGHPPG